MTVPAGVELLGEAPDDEESVFVSILLPLRPLATSNERKPGEPYPFCLVNSLGGPEDVDCGWGDPVVQIHTLCEKRLGQLAARNESDNTHRRILWFARNLEDVPLEDGRMATIDYIKVFQRPRRIEAVDKEIIQYIGRYQIGLSYAQVS